MLTDSRLLSSWAKRLAAMGKEKGGEAMIATIISINNSIMVEVVAVVVAVAVVVVVEVEVVVVVLTTL